MRHLFYTLICLLLFAAPVMADAPNEVQNLLKGKIDAVMVLLQDQTVDKPQRNQKIIDIITPVFDYQTMAKLSLGKKYWPALSMEKQAVFSDLFIERMQKSYLEKLDLYSDEEIVYGEPLEKGEKIQIPTTLLSKDNRIDLLYKFYRTTTEWKIYDVEIGGVSVIQSYRSQFDGVLSEGTIDDLIEKLSSDGVFTISDPDAKGTRAGSN